MGREIKRVAAGFNWPLGVVWKGFLSPKSHYRASKTCEKCGGSGSSPTAKRLHDQWYGNAPFRPEDRGSIPFSPTHPVIVRMANRNESKMHKIGHSYFRADQESVRLSEHFNRSWSHHLNDADVAALVAAGRLMDFTHIWSRETGWVKREPAVVPTAREVNDWSLSGLSHDSCNAWAVIRAECKRLGEPNSCRSCDGHGAKWMPIPNTRKNRLKFKRRANHWKAKEPPAGPAYQVWETVSEGSPITPAFERPEDLAQWCVDNRPWKSTSSYETWMKFIVGSGWAPSMIQSGGTLYHGEECVLLNQ